MSLIHIETAGDTAAQRADALAQALLAEIRALAEERPGSYAVRAQLAADGSYHWDWNWWPPPAPNVVSSGGGAGGGGGHE